MMLCKVILSLLIANTASFDLFENGESCVSDSKPISASAALQVGKVWQSSFMETGAEPCGWPINTEYYSVITRDNATIHSNTVRKGLAVGGFLIDGTPTECGEVMNMSIIAETFIGERWNFTELCIVGQPLSSKIYWPQMEFLAMNAEPNDYPGDYKVVVFNTGGTYSTDSFYTPGLDAGTPSGLKTLVVFNTAMDIVLDASATNEPFLATVLAPFSLVTMMARTDRIDGTIIAREFGGLTIVTEPEAEIGKTTLVGDLYDGPITCTEAWTPPSSTSTASKILIGCPEASFMTMTGCTCMSAWMHMGEAYQCCSTTPDRDIPWCPVREGADCDMAVESADGSHWWDACPTPMMMVPINERPPMPVTLSPGMPGTMPPTMKPAPGTMAPGTMMPGTPAPMMPGTPAPMMPGTMAPGTMMPGTMAPGTMMPGTMAPGTMAPGTMMPGTMAPGTMMPGTPAPMMPGTPAPMMPGTPAPMMPGTPAPMMPGTPAPLVPNNAPEVEGEANRLMPVTNAPVTVSSEQCIANITEHNCKCLQTWMYAESEMHCCQYTPDHDKPWCYVVDGANCPNSIKTSGEGGYWDNCAPYGPTTTTTTQVCFANITEHNCKCQQTWMYAGSEMHCCQYTPDVPEGPWCYILNGADCEGSLKTSGEGDYWDYCAPITTTTTTAGEVCFSNVTEHGCNCMQTWMYAGQEEHCCVLTVGETMPWCYIVDGADCEGALKTSGDGGYWDYCAPYGPTTTTTTAVCISNITEHGCHCMDTWLYAGNEEHCCQETPDNEYPWCYIADGADCEGALKTSGDGGYWDNCAPYKTTTTTTAMCYSNITDHNCHCMDTWLYGGVDKHCCQRTPDNERPWCYVADGVDCDGAIKTSGDGGYWDNCPEP